MSSNHRIAIPPVRAALLASVAQTVLSFLFVLMGWALIDFAPVHVGLANSLIYLATVPLLTLLGIFGATSGYWIVCRKFLAFGRAMNLLSAFFAWFAMWAALLVLFGILLAVLPTTPEAILIKVVVWLILIAVLFLFAAVVLFKTLRIPPGISRLRAAVALASLLIATSVLSHLPEEAHFLFLRNRVIQARFIPSGAMQPTLLEGDRLIISVAARHHAPRRGEIWVFYRPEDPPLTWRQVYHSSHGRFDDHAMIKRVIGLPGETIEIRAGAGVLVNGRLLQEPYVPSPAMDPFGPFRIPEGQVFMLGDNRNNSMDSRFFGPVPFEKLLGRAEARFFPLDRLGSMETAADDEARE